MTRAWSTVLSALAIAVVPSTSSAASAASAAGCFLNSECGGDRVCSPLGTCVARDATAGPPRVAGVGDGSERAAPPASPRASVGGDAPATSTGWELGLRLGLAWPLGKNDGAMNPDGTDDAMSRFVKRAIPVEVDVGFRIVPSLYVGGYLAYAPGWVGSFLADACPSNGTECTVRTFRAGLQVHYHLLPDAEIDPWIGVGFGYEEIRFGMANGATARTADVTFSGVELLNVQAGADYRLSPGTGIGPFASLALARYTSGAATYSGDFVPPSTSGDVDAPTTHGWITVGVRGTFVL